MYMFTAFIIFTISQNIERLEILISLRTIIIILGKPKQGEVIKNVQCGYDVRKEDYVSIPTSLTP